VSTDALLWAGAAAVTLRVSSLHHSRTLVSAELHTTASVSGAGFCWSKHKAPPVVWLCPVLCCCSYASAACPVTVLQHNIFIPSAKLKGKFNKVGSCIAAPQISLRSRVQVAARFHDVVNLVLLAHACQHSTDPECDWQPVIAFNMSLRHRP
jgi:hypothetical protein